MIGKQILHYKILEKLGEGGMGIVYLAEDTKLERKVAIKFLPPQIAQNGDEHKRFEVEARAAAALNHPNISTIYAIEEFEGEMFIVMEYIEGQELRQIISAAQGQQPMNSGKNSSRFVSRRETFLSGLTIAYCTDIASQIASGLQAAHEKGIVHRDIKSANIMITDKGQVKIMDFGLARFRGESDLTKAGTTLGTVGYMSPEQTRGETVDQRADIWSLGVVLYEILTGKMPFKGEYEAVTIYNILNEEPLALQHFRQDIPETLTVLVAEMLKKDINKRIKSTEEIVARLQVKPDKSQPEKAEKSIAVLYFENMSPDKENEYFCAGITEDIIIDLSKISELKVIPRSDVFPFRSREVNSGKVGEILGVSYVLEGSVRKAGKQIRVTAQLVNVQTGFPVWAERYDRLLEDIFELQVEVSQKIAIALKISLSESEKESLIQRPTEDLRAYDFYMRGRELLTAEGKNNNESAIRMFEHAISIDPNYSLAYVALAEAFSFQYIFYDGDQKWLGKIISANAKALELDPELDEVEVAKGMIFYHQQRFPEAKRTFENFLKKKADNYAAHHWLGALAELTNDYDTAIEQFTRTSQIKPYSEEPWVHLEMTYRRKGDIRLAQTAGDKILELVERKLSINANDAIALSRAATYKANQGDKIAALNDVKTVLEIAPNDGLAIYNCACTYATIGKKEESLALLQKAIKIGFRNIIMWIEKDPDFEIFRDDPQFKAILAGAGE